MAAYKGDEQLVVFLLQHGAKPDSKSGDGFTPLLAACKRGNVGVAGQLIKAGADVNTGAPAGATALGASVLSGNPELVSLLLSSSANPNPRGIPPLQLAIAGSFQSLLESNEIADYKSLKQEYVQIVKKLLKAGANPNYPSGFGGILHVAVGLAPIDVIQLLLDAGATVSGKTVADSPEIKFARESRRNDVVRLLTQAWIKQHSKFDGDRPT